MVRETMAAVPARLLNKNGRKDCFELFGYDFIIDCSGKVWLIEVNTNPSLEESNSYLKKLFPKLIDQAFKLTLDQVFPLPQPKIEPKRDISITNL